MTSSRDLIAAILRDPLDPALPLEVQAFLFGTKEGAALVRDALDGDLRAAIRLVEKLLPGWQYRIGRCRAVDWAMLMPDWDSPLHRPRLELELNSEPGIYHDIEVPIRPPHGEYPTLALVIAVIKTVAYTRRCLNNGRIARRRQLREERKANSATW